MSQTYIPFAQTHFGIVIPDGKFEPPEDSKVIVPQILSKYDLDYHHRSADKYGKIIEYTKRLDSKVENDSVNQNVNSDEESIFDSLDFSIRNQMVADDIRIMKFIEMFLYILKIAEKSNAPDERKARVFGGFVRDLIYVEKAKDIDVQFEHPFDLQNFLIDLSEKYKVRVYSRKRFCNYFNLDNMSKLVFLLVKIYVEIDGFKYPIDLITSRKGRRWDRYEYDFSANMYSVKLREKLPDVQIRSSDKSELKFKTDYLRILSDPYKFFKIRYAMDAERKYGFEHYDRSLEKIWGEDKPFDSGRIILNTFREEYEKYPFPDIHLLIRYKPKKFLVSHNVKRFNQFMMNRFQKLIDKGFTPLFLNTCNREYCNCIMSTYPYDPNEYNEKYENSEDL